MMNQPAEDQNLSPEGKIQYFYIQETEKFVAKNNFKEIFRCNSIKEIQKHKGYYFTHNNIIISLNSASNIRGKIDGVILQIDENMNKNFISFNVNICQNEFDNIQRVDYFCFTGFYLRKMNKCAIDSFTYLGILGLRAKLKNEKYKKEIEKKYHNLNRQNQILYKICCLPDNQFLNIMKYSLIHF